MRFLHLVRARGGLRLKRIRAGVASGIDMTAGGRIVVALDGDHSSDLGHEILLGFGPERAHLFPSAARCGSPTRAAGALDGADPGEILRKPSHG